MISIPNGSKEFQAYDCETSYFLKPPRAGCRPVGVFFAASPATLSLLYAPLAHGCLSKTEPTIAGYFCNEVATDRVILCCFAVSYEQGRHGKDSALLSFFGFGEFSELLQVRCELKSLVARFCCPF